MNPKFEKPVYVIDLADMTTKQMPYHDLIMAFRDETTAPTGVGPRFHAKGEHEVWRHNPNGTRTLVETFDTEEEQENWLLDRWEWEACDNGDMPPFAWTEEEARAELATFEDMLLSEED